MSYERALVTQAGPYMLAAKTQALIDAEVGKGCNSDIISQPVALEPAFHCFRQPKDVFSVKDDPAWLYEPVPSLKDIVRLQVWISPEQPFSWDAFELFIKQLSLVSHRVGLEIIGNQEKVTILLLCHRRDVPTVVTSFISKLNLCKLSPLQDPWPFGDPVRTFSDIGFCDYYPLPPYHHLLTRPGELHRSPFEALLAAMTHISPPALGIHQTLFQPTSPANEWHRNVEILTDLEYVSKLVGSVGHFQRYSQQTPSGDLRQMSGDVETKAHNDKPFYTAAFRIAVAGAGKDRQRYLQMLAVFSGLFQHGGRPLCFLTENDYRPVLSDYQIHQMFTHGATYRPGFLLNSAELTGLVHLPPIETAEKLDLVIDTAEPLVISSTELSEGTPIGTSSAVGQDHLICIPPPIRLRHTHVIGKPDMGKSTMIEAMILDDIRNGYGVAVLDPHGDLIDRLLCLIGEEYIERTIHFDPGDRHWVPLWNPLQPIAGQDIGRVADDMIGTLKSFVTGWGDRMENILRHSIFGLLHLPQSTMLDIADLLRKDSAESESMRKLLIEVVENEEARKFWKYDFINYRSEELAPAKHKLSKLLVSGTISLMLSQPNSAFSFRKIMDEGMVFLGNLSNLGTEVRQVLGGLLLAVLHSTALSRVDTPIEDRRPFHIYLDEAHRFITDTLEDVIAETRKYGVSLTLAHQYLRQFTAQKIGAVASVGTTAVFNLDTKDAAYLRKDFQELVEVSDIINLEPRQAIVRCGTKIVKIQTLEREEIPQTNYREQIVAYSRKNYCQPVETVRQIVRGRNKRNDKAFEPLVPKALGGAETRRSLPKEVKYGGL